MTHFLFLTYRMSLGYGVDVAISNITQNLIAMGHQVTIGCLETDGHYSKLDIRLVDPSPTSIARLVDESGCSCIIAHTTPFFEIMPLLSSSVPRWALEYGDPSPEFFPHDGIERGRIKEAKTKDCYPAVNGVIAISHFIRSDIHWPAAKVVHIGCDHVPDLGPKGALDFYPDSEKSLLLKVGTLMRLGQGESNYKGNQLFLDIVEKCIELGVPARFIAMGRGTSEDSAFFEAKNITTHLNAPDNQKWDYLRGLDVFISPSMWEGFNLPLAEAQALGTMGIAFDTGAHPEVTPFVVSSVNEVVALLKRLAQNRSLLKQNSLLSYRFVRNRFFWEKCSLEILRITSGVCVSADQRSLVVRCSPMLIKSGLRRTQQFFSAIKIGGAKYALSKFIDYCKRRIQRQ